MSDAKSNYLENKILDHVLATTAYTAPSAVYLSLHYTSPGELNTVALKSLLVDMLGKK
jgi:hypothetical protein